MQYFVQSEYQWLVKCIYIELNVPFLVVQETVEVISEYDKELWSKANVWMMSDVESNGEGWEVQRTLQYWVDPFIDLVKWINGALGQAQYYGEPSRNLPNHHCDLTLVDNDKLKSLETGI